MLKGGEKQKLGHLTVFKSMKSSHWAAKTKTEAKLKEEDWVCVVSSRI